VLALVRPKVTLPAVIASVRLIVPVLVVKIALSGEVLLQVEPDQFASVVFQLLFTAPTQVRSAAWMALDVSIMYDAVISIRGLLRVFIEN
jgi:hypothetical protein